MATDLTNRLREATQRAQQEDELPDFLAERIFAIAIQQCRQDLYSALEELIEQISIYDTYGQTGYIGMGVNSVILEGTISRLEERLKNRK